MTAPLRLALAQVNATVGEIPGNFRVRYFGRGREPMAFPAGKSRVGVTVCEDIWVRRGPVARLAREGAGVILNVSASPYQAGSDVRGGAAAVRRRNAFRRRPGGSRPAPGRGGLPGPRAGDPRLREKRKAPATPRHTRSRLGPGDRTVRSWGLWPEHGIADIGYHARKRGGC